MGLILTWAVIISFAIIMYVLLDGFDLGIGILFPFVKTTEHRNIMMNTVAPVWDGNETWLVFGAASLYAAFPVAYSTLLPTLYLPIMVMLAALIFRGVAFEFRFKAHKSRFIWDIAFCAGSTLAAFSQGLVLGTFVQGYGDSMPLLLSDYHWLTPFSVMTGVAVVVGYGLLGATWLIVKTTGELQDKMFTFAKILLFGVSVFMAIVSLWSPFISSYILHRWFDWPNTLYLAPLPILTTIAVLFNFFALHKRYEFWPFIFSVALFVLAYLGFCISAYPYIIPHAVPVWDAASAPSSLKFILVGAVVLLPVLIGYTVYSYYIFRGKITSGEEHYH